MLSLSLSFTLSLSLTLSHSHKPHTMSLSLSISIYHIHNISLSLSFPLPNTQTHTLGLSVSVTPGGLKIVGGRVNSVEKDLFIKLTFCTFGPKLFSCNSYLFILNAQYSNLVLIVISSLFQILLNVKTKTSVKLHY